jgi:multidrug resistance efflux pump
MRSLVEQLRELEPSDSLSEDAAARIEQLEAALRAATDENDRLQASAGMAQYWREQYDLVRAHMKKVRAALDNLCEDEGCPNAGTPHVCINRQENDDVFKGFRGNNEA